MHLFHFIILLIIFMNRVDFALNLEVKLIFRRIFILLFIHFNLKIKNWMI